MYGKFIADDSAETEYFDPSRGVAWKFLTPKEIYTIDDFEVELKKLS